jgi:hypothetical protein
MSREALDHAPGHGLLGPELSLGGRVRRSWSPWSPTGVADPRVDEALKDWSTRIDHIFPELIRPMGSGSTGR